MTDTESSASETSPVAETPAAQPETASSNGHKEIEAMIHAALANYKPTAPEAAVAAVPEKKKRAKKDAPGPPAKKTKGAPAAAGKAALKPNKAPAKAALKPLKGILKKAPAPKPLAKSVAFKKTVPTKAVPVPAARKPQPVQALPVKTKPLHTGYHQPGPAHNRLSGMYSQIFS